LRRADEEILQVNRQLEQSNRYKSEFLANMSHELRTPLNAILGFSEILLDLTMNLTAGERTEFLRNIHSSGQHLLGLINDILDLAKIEAGKMELHAEEMPVKEAIQEVTGILDPMARQQGLQVTTVGAAEAGVIKADRSKFKQVLYNLLSNAVKFTPPPGQITLTVKDSPSQLTVSVQDTGIGMKPEDLPKLFREFEQIDGSYTRRYQGTGLGLALCRRFVQMHGGRIWAESQFGKGSTFTFTIPRGLRPAAELPVEEALQPIETMELPLALVVEDDPASSQRMTAEIQGVGFRVAHARDGDEAVRKAMEILPDLVVMETVLPAKDGWQVLQELRARAATADVPVLVCSVQTVGNADHAGRAAPHRAGDQGTARPGPGPAGPPGTAGAGDTGRRVGGGGLRGVSRARSAGGPGKSPGRGPGRRRPRAPRARVGGGAAWTPRPARPAGPGRSFTQGASDGLERRYTLWPLPARCRIARHQGPGGRSEAKEDRA